MSNSKKKDEYDEYDLNKSDIYSLEEVQKKGSKVKFDCFAFRDTTNNLGIRVCRCEALNDLYCKKDGKCNFYMTREEKNAKFEKRVNYEG